MEMADCLKDDMHLIIDEPAIRAARRAVEKKEGQVESWVPMELLSESESRKRKRADEPDDARNNGESQPRAAKRVTVESGPSGHGVPDQ